MAVAVVIHLEVVLITLSMHIYNKQEANVSSGLLAIFDLTLTSVTRSNLILLLDSSNRVS